MLLFLLLTGCVADRTSSRSPPPRGYLVHGIDVSHHQGWIDWPTVGASGIDFAFLKATEGTTHVDRRFRQNRQRARDHVPVGAYHYFSACRGGAEQADHFLALVPEPGELPAVLDVEADPRCNRGDRLEGIEQQVGAWLDRVEDAHGTRPLLYSNRAFHDRHLREVHADRWIASYSRDPGGDWVFWQYTSDGRVPGVVGPVDRNVYAGDALTLER